MLLNFYMTPTTCLMFMPVDTHLDKSAYFQKKKKCIKCWPAGAEIQTFSVISEIDLLMIICEFNCESPEAL